MQTPAILNISSPASGAAAVKPAASASGGAFNQMLSQQIAERRENAQTHTQARSPASQSAGNGKAPEARPAGQASKNETKPAEQGNAAREAGEASASDRQREEQAAADAGNATPTATELIAQAAGALLMLQQTADAAGDAAATLQDVAADGAARAGKLNLPGADPVLRNTGGDADFRAALQEAADPGAAADVALGGKAMDKLTELAAAKMQDTPAIAGAVAQLQPGMQELAQVAAGKTGDRLTPHVGTPAWDQALGQKVVWMVAGAQQSASLSLNPPDLGPLQIVLNVSNGQADASFYAAQPEVRQALEAALPRLRDMMNEAGVELGQASVSAGMPDRHDQPGERSAPQASHGASDKGGDEAALPGNRVVIPVTQGQGLVDTFV